MKKTRVIWRKIRHETPRGFPYLLESSAPVAGLMHFPEANHFSMLVRSYLQQQRHAASGTAGSCRVAVGRVNLREAVDSNHGIFHNFHGYVPVQRGGCGVKNGKPRATAHRATRMHNTKVEMCAIQTDDLTDQSYLGAPRAIQQEEQ